MHERVLAYIREHRLIKAGDRVAAAVSGGADSVALLHLLLRFRDELGVVLSVLHFHHRIRDEADDDENFVQALAKEHGLDFHRAEGDAPNYAREHKISLETAARKLRYDFFRGLLGRFDRIATAHTLNDQAETVLMRMIRGAGTKGLAGIYPEQRFPPRDTTGGSIIRPMLCVTRPEVEAWLAQLGQIWRHDATNLDLKHLRNRVRHQLLPLLERDFNSGILHVLSDLAEVSREEEYYFRKVIAGILVSDESSRLQISVLKSLPLALQRRTIRYCAEHLGIVLDFQHVSRILGLADSPEGGRECELPGGWAAIRHNRELCFEKRSQNHEAPCAYEYALPVPGEVTVKEIGSVIKAFVRADPEGASGYNPKQSVAPVALETGLIVRNWRPGDRFSPAHTKAPKKLKELLQRRHIAARERALWPVVSCGDVLIWVRGFPAAPTCFPGSGSTELVIEEVSTRGR
jgi:tRNA(Ile)-lysidine synthase